MSSPGSHLIPSLCYLDAPAAIAWLEEAFGLRAHMIVPGATEQQVAHAQLKMPDGRSMIMLYSQRDDEYGSLQRSPRDLGGCNQALYVVVEDVDAHHARAAAAGAETVLPPTDQDYGGRAYTCRDLEGHVWSFGSYDPWVEPA